MNNSRLGKEQGKLASKGETGAAWPRTRLLQSIDAPELSRTAVPYRLRHMGYGIWIGASEYQLRPGPTGRFEEDYKTSSGL